MKIMVYTVNLRHGKTLCRKKLRLGAKRIEFVRNPTTAGCGVKLKNSSPKNPNYTRNSNYKRTF
jgi:hypothetical protein